MDKQENEGWIVIEMWFEDIINVFGPFATYMDADDFTKLPRNNRRHMYAYLPENPPGA